MLGEGFDIHHVNGDHDDNTPNNLVLINNRDHTLLHNGKRPPKGRTPKNYVWDKPLSKSERARRQGERLQSIVGIMNSRVVSEKEIIGGEEPFSSEKSFQDSLPVSKKNSNPEFEWRGSLRA